MTSNTVPFRISIQRSPLSLVWRRVSVCGPPRTSTQLTLEGSKMGNILNTVKLIMAIVPLLPDLIKAVEVAGNGLVKFQTIVGIVVSMLEVLPDSVKAVIHADVVKSVVGKAVDLIVALFNAAGEFKHSNP